MSVEPVFYLPTQSSSDESSNCKEMIDLTSSMPSQNGLVVVDCAAETISVASRHSDSDSSFSFSGCDLSDSDASLHSTEMFLQETWSFRRLKKR